MPLSQPTLLQHQCVMNKYLAQVHPALGGQPQFALHLVLLRNRLVFDHTDEVWQRQHTMKKLGPLALLKAFVLVES